MILDGPGLGEQVLEERLTQVSDIDDDEAWGWPCLRCRAHNPVDSRRCANCGAQLREDDDDLFTTVAADNAEVVPPHMPFARDNMWSTAANAPEDVIDAVDESELIDEASPSGFGGPPGSGGSTGFGGSAGFGGSTGFGGSAEQDLWDDIGANGTGRDRVNGASQDWVDAGDGLNGHPGVNGHRNGSPVGSAMPSFTAEPTDRPSDVVDEPFVVGDGPPLGSVRPGDPPLFGGRSDEPSASAADPHRVGAFGGSARTFGRPATPFEGPSFEHAAGAAGPMGHGPTPPPYPYDVPPAVASGWQDAAPPPVPDPHGLAAAVGRLRPEAAERAVVPISVSGALLRRDEAVLGVVTGQMLGHAAVVVLTTQRVLVVNGRRWQPIVDTFDLGPGLVVRGRHDRDVASLTFTEGDRLSTVDAITEVGLAVELAERIRGA